MVLAVLKRTDFELFLTLGWCDDFQVMKFGLLSLWDAVVVLTYFRKVSHMVGVVVLKGLIVDCCKLERVHKS